MKTKLLLSILILFLAACQKEVLLEQGTVTGIVTNGTGIGMPVPGMKMYLGNLNIKPDTLNPANNRRILADSCLTDASGKYFFSSIPEGNWAVSPALNQSEITNITSSGDSSAFSISDQKKDYNVNFRISPAQNDNFQILFTYKKNGTIKVKPRRTCFRYFLDYYYQDYQTVEVNAYMDESSHSFQWGYWAFETGMTNHFTFEFYYADDTKCFDAWILLPLTGCPPGSEYEVDMKAKTCTWIRNFEW